VRGRSPWQLMQIADPPAGHRRLRRRDGNSRSRHRSRRRLAPGGAQRPVFDIYDSCGNASLSHPSRKRRRLDDLDRAARRPATFDNRKLSKPSRQAAETALMNSSLLRARWTEALRLGNGKSSILASGRLSRRKPGEDPGASPPDERLEGLSATGQRKGSIIRGPGRSTCVISALVRPENGGSSN